MVRNNNTTFIILRQDVSCRGRNDNSRPETLIAELRAGCVSHLMPICCFYVVTAIPSGTFIAGNEPWCLYCPEPIGGGSVSSTRVFAFGFQRNDLKISSRASIYFFIVMLVGMMSIRTWRVSRR